MICCIRPSGEDTTGPLGLGHFLHTFWRWVWRHFKYILDLGHSLDSFWKKVGDFLETFWFWRVFGDILVTFWRHFGIWMVFGYILESFWIHFGILRYHNWTLVPFLFAQACKSIIYYPLCPLFWFRTRSLQLSYGLLYGLQRIKI